MRAAPGVPPTPRPPPLQVSPRLAGLHLGLGLGPCAMEVDGGRGGAAEGPCKAPGGARDAAPASSSQVSNCSSTLTVPALEAARHVWQQGAPAWS